MLSVMVVDRESDVLGLFEAILTSMGHRVRAQEFLNDMADSEEYDLMILDMESFGQELKSLLNAYSKSKLCASSIWEESRLPPEIDVEYDYYLQKPFKLDSLREILDSVKELRPSPCS